MEGMGTLAADSSAEFYLLDRVINVMTNGAVPYKLKGTIVGIHGVQLGGGCGWGLVLYIRTAYYCSASAGSKNFLKGAKLSFQGLRGGGNTRRKGGGARHLPSLAVIMPPLENFASHMLT